MAGLEVPRVIAMYGIAIREPASFSEDLSPELMAKLPRIVEAIAQEEFRENT
jgi:hypothetical protein